jgi:hypothetical protein
MFIATYETQHNQPFPPSPIPPPAPPPPHAATIDINSQKYTLLRWITRVNKDGKAFRIEFV